MAEPDPDRGHVHRPPPYEVALVIPGGDGAVLAEMAEGPLDDGALLIGRGVEGWRSAGGIDVGGRRAPRPGGGRARPPPRGAPRHGPRGARRLITASAQPVQDHPPGPAAGPAAMPVIDGLPVPGTPRRAPPRAPCA